MDGVEEEINAVQDEEERERKRKREHNNEARRKKKTKINMNFKSMNLSTLPYERKRSQVPRNGDQQSQLFPDTERMHFSLCYSSFY